MWFISKHQRFSVKKQKQTSALFKPHLFNKVSLEVDVSASFVRKRNREDVSQSLCLMDDGISERQVLSVSNLDLTVSYDLPQLLLDLVLFMKQDMILGELFMVRCLIIDTLNTSALIYTFSLDLSLFFL